MIMNDLTGRMTNGTLAIEGMRSGPGSLRLAGSRSGPTAASSHEFMAGMAHQMRTPLNSIIGFSQLLLDRAEERDDLRQADYLKEIRSSGERLLDLLNAIVDISRIELGSVPVAKAPVDLRKLLERSLDSVKSEAADLGTYVRAELGQGRNGTEIRADSRILKRIVREMLSSALKRAQGGIMTVRVRQSETTAAVEMIAAEPEASGPGQSANPTRVSGDDMFFLERSSRAEELRLAKRLAELHGSVIRIDEDGPGGESRMVLELAADPLPRKSGPIDRPRSHRKGEG
jgi:signal transduction histidine kinase